MVNGSWLIISLKGWNNKTNGASSTAYSLLLKPAIDAGGKKHEIWKDSFDVKECRTEKFVLQKLLYIHNNPCSGKWKLAESPELYLHSSALFYLSGKHSSYPVKDYKIFLYPDT
jgi:hypothetical protein